MNTARKDKKVPPEFNKEEIERQQKSYAAIMKQIQLPENKTEAYENWKKISTVTNGTGWISPDFDEPMELI